MIDLRIRFYYSPKFCRPVEPVLIVGVLPDQLCNQLPFWLVTSLKPLHP